MALNHENDPDKFVAHTHTHMNTPKNEIKENKTVCACLSKKE